MGRHFENSAKREILGGENAIDRAGVERVDCFCAERREIARWNCQSATCRGGESRRMSGGARSVFSCQARSGSVERQNLIAVRAVGDIAKPCELPTNLVPAEGFEPPTL